MLNLTLYTDLSASEDSKNHAKNIINDILDGTYIFVLNVAHYSRLYRLSNKRLLLIYRLLLHDMYVYVYFWS